MPRLLRLLACAALFASVAPATSFASHLIGDEFSYAFVDSSSAGLHYRVTLSTYADCLNGQPEAITQDNPAFFAIYHTGSATLFHADSVSYTTSSIVPSISSGPCGIGFAYACILKKTFVLDCHLPASTTGYTIVYSRCCKNAAITNVVAPGNDGSAYVCTIPPSGTAARNNSAVFTNYPPETIALNSPFLFDCSATDADGDSLSYELCPAFDGASSSDIKPWPAPLPSGNVNYSSPFTYSSPMACSVPLSVDPVTGILSGTPDLVGRYLIAVACNEWRGGVKINTNRREFELAVQNIGPGFHPFARPDTAIFVGDSVHFRAPAGTSYLWSPSTYLSSTTIPDPVGFFPTAGTFHYVLREVSDSGCTGYDTLTVVVLRVSEMAVPNAFTPNNDGVNDFLLPKPVKSCTLVNFKVFTRAGQLVYSGGPNDPGWDGTFHGKKMDLGVYHWEVTYIDNTGQPGTRQGNSTLIR